MSGLCDCHSTYYSDFPDFSLRRQACIIHRVINLCNLPTALSRMPELAEPSPQKYVGLHFLEVSGFSPEGSAGRPAMMMRMTTKICYIIQWQGVRVEWGCFRGLCRAELCPRDICVTISALFDEAATEEENLLFFRVFLWPLRAPIGGECNFWSSVQNHSFFAYSQSVQFVMILHHLMVKFVF